MGSFSLDSCRIQTVCLIYRQRLDCLHSSSPLLASCGEPSIMRYSILVPRFHLLVFSLSSSGFAFLAFRYSLSDICLPVSRFSFLVLSSIPWRYHCRFLRLSRLLVFRPLAFCLSLSLFRSSTF